MAGASLSELWLLLWAPLVAGVIVAVIAAPLGCFVVWRRMAYFGAALSHTALLGVALGLALDVQVLLAVGLVSIALAVLLGFLDSRLLGLDTLLGILAHGGLAAGLILISLLEGLRVDLFGYLFGDILAVTPGDLVLIAVAGALVLPVELWLWRVLLVVTLDDDLARVEGLPVALAKLVFLISVAVLVALAMKVVGILLVTSLLLIPAAAARQLAVTPEAMAAGAGFVGVVSVAAGLGASAVIDWPAGPGIVAVACTVFLLAFAVGAWRRRGGQ